MTIYKSVGLDVLLSVQAYMYLVFDDIRSSEFPIAQFT